jgi:hypothetical protein
MIAEAERNYLQASAPEFIHIYAASGKERQILPNFGFSCCYSEVGHVSTRWIEFDDRCSLIKVFSKSVEHGQGSLTSCYPALDMLLALGQFGAFRICVIATVEVSEATIIVGVSDATEMTHSQFLLDSQLRKQNVFYLQ